LREVRRVAVEDYLSTIYRLEEVFGVARTVDISAELGVKPATVTKVLRKLSEQGYVTWSRFRGFKLTEAGLRAVRPLIRNHRICEHFLHVLGFNLLEAHVYAHYMEHLPQVIIDGIHRFLGSPKLCPHGNPIPGEGVAELRARPLKDLGVGEEATVVGFRGELRTYLAEALERGLTIGSRVKVLAKTKGGLTVEVGGREQYLSMKVAATIMTVTPGS
jgi:DtxR family Mn-dependent transcriptional regulator